MKLSHLKRTEDASGFSGIGEVAEGVMFEDGTAGLRWLRSEPSMVAFVLMPEKVDSRWALPP